MYQINDLLQADGILLKFLAFLVFFLFRKEISVSSGEGASSANGGGVKETRVTFDGSKAFKVRMVS